MKFLCFGYFDETKWAGMSEAEGKAFMNECFAYDAVLKTGGHFLQGEALQCIRNGVTLRNNSGQIAVTDGPYIETKEYVGGILFLEARDLNHAIQLMSKHPGVRHSAFEIRPADEVVNAMCAAGKC